MQFSWLLLSMTIYSTRFITMDMLPREQIQPDRRKNINSLEFKNISRSLLILLSLL